MDAVLPTRVVMAAGAADQSKQEKEFKRMETMICAMTPKESKSPQILSAKRHVRIAKGSGVTVTELDTRLNQDRTSSVPRKTHGDGRGAREENGS